MRAERDDDEFFQRPVKSRPERRLAWEIALGVWLGGVALSVTGWLGWYLWLRVALSNLQLG